MNKLSVSDENFIVRELSPSRLEIRLKLEESYITEEDSFKNDFSEEALMETGLFYYDEKKKIYIERFFLKIFEVKKIF